jgi:hypothetical protein
MPTHCWECWGQRFSVLHADLRSIDFFLVRDSMTQSNIQSLSILRRTSFAVSSCTTSVSIAGDDAVLATDSSSPGIEFRGCSGISLSRSDEISLSVRGTWHETGMSTRPKQCYRSLRFLKRTLAVYSGFGCQPSVIANPRNSKGVQDPSGLLQFV